MIKQNVHLSITVHVPTQKQKRRQESPPASVRPSVRPPSASQLNLDASRRKLRDMTATPKRERKEGWKEGRGRGFNLLIREQREERVARISEREVCLHAVTTTGVSLSQIIVDEVAKWLGVPGQ